MQPIPQPTSSPPYDTDPGAHLWPDPQKFTLSAPVIFFAVRSERAHDAVEIIKTALPQGSLLFTSRGGAWSPVQTSLDWRDLLTARQFEILELLGNNQSNKEIGRALGLSHFTVRNHIAQLMRLLNVSTRGAAAALWNSTDR